VAQLRVPTADGGEPLRHTTRVFPPHGVQVVGLASSSSVVSAPRCVSTSFMLAKLFASSSPGLQKGPRCLLGSREITHQSRAYAASAWGSLQLPREISGCDEAT